MATYDDEEDERLTRDELEEAREDALKQRDSYAKRFEMTVAKSRGEQRAVRAVVGATTAFALGKKMTDDPSMKVLGLELDVAVAVGGLAILMAKERPYSEMDLGDTALEAVTMSAVAVAAFRAGTRK